MAAVWLVGFEKQLNIYYAKFLCINIVRVVAFCSFRSFERYLNILQDWD